ncbi:MAG: PadR family transcriptional regulator [Coriobacteriia bacterium]|nr:PadR family transcriptional regulator [Coriobacteriia bacterium]
MSVKYGLLALLNRRSMHGYEMRRELEVELGPEWAVNYGQIYSTLERLVRDALVVQSETVASGDAPDRKLYTVTPAGRTELHQWFLTPIDSSDPSRDGLHAKILLALTGDVPVDKVIQAERKGQLRRIGQLTELKEKRDAELELAAVLQLDMAIMKTEAVLKWLDTAEARIAKATAAGPDGVARQKGSPRSADEGAAHTHETTGKRGRR